MMDQWWPMPWFPAFPLIFIAICLFVAFFVMMPMIRRHRDSYDAPKKTALDILKERFARGEIDKAEYEEKKRLLS